MSWTQVYACRASLDRIAFYPQAAYELSSKKRPTTQRRVSARKSPIHGTGVFALVPIKKGARIIEYKGERRLWTEASEDYPDAGPGEMEHTFLFEIDEDFVIDANIGGNSSRWINHSCKPNCETIDEEGRIFIESIRDIKAGEELFFDYNIQLDEPHNAKAKKRFPCFCGNRNCRGTLVGKKG